MNTLIPYTLLNLIKSHDSYQIEVAKIMYNYFHGSLPYTLSDSIAFTHDIHGTRHTSHIIACPFIGTTVSSSKKVVIQRPVELEYNST